MADMDGSKRAQGRDVSRRRWALVTGGSRGIGRACAVDLARRGWNVAIVYLRNEAAAAEAVAEVRTAGVDALSVACNVARAEERKELISALKKGAGALTGIVHAAGLGALAPVLGARPARWQIAWETHVRGLLELLHELRPMIHAPAAIVTFSSLGAHHVMEGYAPIGASKGALETLVRYLAVELAPEGINVNCVCGGPVDTESLRSFSHYERLAEESRHRPPGRLGEPDDLAPIVSFLLGEEARWIRGQVIVADGGFSLL